MKKYLKIIGLFLFLFTLSFTLPGSRSLEEKDRATQWISENKNNLILKNSERDSLTSADMLNHTESDKENIKKSFLSYVRSVEFENAYYQASTMEIIKISTAMGKTITPSLSQNEYRTIISNNLKNNFQNFSYNIKSIKWMGDTITLNVVIEGKSTVFPAVLNMQETQEGNINFAELASNISNDMNSSKIVKTFTLQFVYKLNGDTWILEQQSYMKLLNALVFVNFYDKYLESEF